MDENTQARYEEKVKELLALGKKKKNVLEYQEVVDFFADYPEVQLYIQNIDSLLNQWLPFFERSNRSYLTVAIGCTGGQHRSVAITRAVADFIRQRGYPATENHRDMTRA